MRCAGRPTDPRRRHAAGRGELELVGFAFHVLDSADAAHHIDADPAEIGRNYRTDIGMVADAKAALGMLAEAAARHEAPGPRIAARATSRAAGRNSPANWITSGVRISSRCARTHPERPPTAVPEDGFIVTDVGWNKNGVAQQFPFTVPGTFITPSGLATMGFGPAAVLGVKIAHPSARRSPSSATAASAPTRR